MFNKIKDAWNYFCFGIDSILSYIGNCLSCKEWRKKKQFNKMRTYMRDWAGGLASEKVKLI